MLRHFFIVLFFIVHLCFGRIHKIETVNDTRQYIELSSFGFYKGGILEIQLLNFTVSPLNKNDLFGFSLDRSLDSVRSPSLEINQHQCLLQQKFSTEDNTSLIYFTLDLDYRILDVKCSKRWHNGIQIYKVVEIPSTTPKTNFLSDKQLLHRVMRESLASSPDFCGLSLPILSEERNNVLYYNISFAIYIVDEQHEGLYNLYFHSCPNYVPNKEVAYNFTMKIREENPGGNFLSVDQIPLPTLCCTLAFLFFLSGCFWLILLKQSQHPILQIHYLMSGLVFVKSLSLAFCGVNYYFIGVKGRRLVTWAVIFYIVNFLKGELFVITLILVGAGWGLIKYVLVSKDKLLLIIVVTFQALANIAEVVLEERGEGAQLQRTWHNISILFDLFCSALVMLPVVWSIRYIKRISRTDLNIVVNLRKVKLFRHFLVMIICLIYLTRIVAYLVRITVPFQYGWLYKLFNELTTYIFFVLTAYKFRPGICSLLANVDEDEDKMLTKTRVVEVATKIDIKPKLQKESLINKGIQEEKENLLSTKTDSEYDYFNASSMTNRLF